LRLSRVVVNLYKKFLELVPDNGLKALFLFGTGAF